MNKKHFRPTADQQLMDGEYNGKIVGAFEKVFKSHYYPNGQRDVLSLRVEVYHSNGVSYLFYNVTWDWTNYHFCQLLENMAVMPEPGAEFTPESLVGKNVMVSVKNQSSQERNFTNIVELRPQSVAVDDRMASGQWGDLEQGGGR